MLSQYLNQAFIQVIDQPLSWQEAIHLAAQPLLQQGYIEESYIMAMFNKAEQFGPFFDIGKQIAIPHARSEEGVNKTGLSLLRVKQPVYLLEQQNHPIDIFIVIAAADNSQHLAALSALSEILIDDDKVTHLKSLDTSDKIAEFFRKEESQ